MVEVLYVFHEFATAGEDHVLFVAPFSRAQNLKKLQDEKHLPAGKVDMFQ